MWCGGSAVAENGVGSGVTWQFQLLGCCRLEAGARVPEDRRPQRVVVQAPHGGVDIQSPWQQG